MKNRLLVVIPAAGIGQRFDKQLPKQYSKLNGKSVIEQSVQPFLDSHLVSKVIIAVSESDSYINNQDNIWKQIREKYKIDFIWCSAPHKVRLLEGLNIPMISPTTKSIRLETDKWYSRTLANEEPHDQNF